MNSHRVSVAIWATGYLYVLASKTRITLELLQNCWKTPSSEVIGLPCKFSAWE